MHLHKDSVAACGHRGPGQRWCQDAVARRRVPCPAWPLHRMRRVKDHAISGFAHPIERAHVGHEVVIAKRRAALGETEL